MSKLSIVIKAINKTTEDLNKKYRVQGMQIIMKKTKSMHQKWDIL